MHGLTYDFTYDKNVKAFTLHYIFHVGTEQNNKGCIIVNGGHMQVWLAILKYVILKLWDGNE